ncbi:MAG: CYTH domain-containing protein [Candidatus Competibacteraceae bacterium]|nr:CYTH domain-containing protein [Candidatus Competibacteraceae bacterium]
MGIEIERKYLVDKLIWRNMHKGSGELLRQGYIYADANKTIRIRATSNKGFITIKGKTAGLSRPEYEYEIPVDEANELLSHFCHSTISKIRYVLYDKGRAWEVDEFLDENEGLIVAEVELDDEKEIVERPDWIDREVTGEEKYYNAVLIHQPYKNWLLHE